MRRLLLLCLLLPSASAQVTFDDDIFPLILGPRCSSCHGQFSAQAGLRYHTYAHATANNAHLRAKSSIESNRMPQGSSLSAELKALYAQWIADGAPESAPQNQAPVAAAGVDFDLDEGAPGSLNGLGSTDDSGIVSHVWAQIGGGDAALNDLGTGLASFTAPAVAEAGDTLLFRLTVTDAAGLSNSDDIAVAVNNLNQAPVAFAGSAFSIGEGASGTLDGTGSSDDAAVVGYAWSQIDGADAELSDTGNGIAGFTAPAVGPAGATLTFRLAVTDGAGLSDSDDILVTVTNINHAPQAMPDGDDAALAGSDFALDGSASQDPDGSIANFIWSQLSGPNVSIANSATGVIAVSAPEVQRPRDIELQLRVVDDLGASDSDTFVTTVYPSTSLQADPGPDREIGAELIAQLISRAPGVPLARVEWQQVPSDSVDLQDADSANAHFQAPAAGATLDFQLEIEDIFGRIAQASVQLRTLASLAIPLRRGWNLLSFPFDLSSDVRLPGMAFTWTGTELEPVVAGTLPARRGIWLHAPFRTQLDAFGNPASGIISSRAETWELLGPVAAIQAPPGYLAAWCFTARGFVALRPGRVLQRGEACFLYYPSAKALNLGESP
jgi:hypothetical protein